VTETDKLVGMITDRDIAIRGVAEGRGPDAKVRAMSPEVKYCFEDEDGGREHGGTRLPVMNRDKRLVGIMALADLAVDVVVGARELFTRLDTGHRTVLLRISDTTPKPTARRSVPQFFDGLDQDALVRLWRATRNK
jgi:CBS domain-containing protein